MPTRTQQKGPVYLRFDDGKGFVTPRDDDQFWIDARPAIEALRQACDADAWVKNFFDEYILSRSMPKPKQHQEKAENNRAFLNSISATGPPDWMAIIAFYTAVHEQFVAAETAKASSPSP